MHPLQQSDDLSDLRQVVFRQTISLPLWAQLFAFVIVACSPLVALKWRRKETIAERQTTPLFAFSLRLLHADQESTLVIARQRFDNIGHTDAAAEAATVSAARISTA
jgi:hypothetical protein